MEKIDRVIELLKKANKDVEYSREIPVFGFQYTYNYKLLGSISKYWFGKHEVHEMIAPLNKDSNNDNRPGIKNHPLQYIVVHDVGNVSKTANSYAHAQYITDGGEGTSWHYSSGDDGIYHQIPDDEIAYHAGDGLKVQYEIYDSLVKATTKNPKVEIIDGYYYLNGYKSNVKAPSVDVVLDNGVKKYSSCGIIQNIKAFEEVGPSQKYQLKTKDINEAGIRIDILENGNYGIGPTYFNVGFGYVSNRLGNLYSIGIETMINEGSNLNKTWHRSAKLVASLLLANNLTLDRVKPHHFFSGKPCPQTLMRSNLWSSFLEMVEIEYYILKEDVEITLEINNEYVDETGIIIKDYEAIDVEYDVIVKSKKESKKVHFVSKHISGELQWKN